MDKYLQNLINGELEKVVKQLKVTHSIFVKDSNEYKAILVTLINLNNDLRYSYPTEKEQKEIDKKYRNKQKPNCKSDNELIELISIIKHKIKEYIAQEEVKSKLSRRESTRLQLFYNCISIFDSCKTVQKNEEVEQPAVQNEVEEIKEETPVQEQTPVVQTTEVVVDEKNGEVEQPIIENVAIIETANPTIEETTSVQPRIKDEKEDKQADVATKEKADKYAYKYSSDEIKEKVEKELEKREQIDTITERREQLRSLFENDKLEDIEIVEMQRLIGDDIINIDDIAKLKLIAEKRKELKLLLKAELPKQTEHGIENIIKGMGCQIETLEEEIEKRKNA